MAHRLFIHATNVHQGGGRSLLNAMLCNLPTGLELKLSLDVRLPLPDYLPANIEIKRVTPTIVDRFKAEKWLADNVESGDLVLCFGNLPPLFKLPARVMLFLQNRYLIENVKLNEHTLKSATRIRMERLWLRSRIGNVDEVIVQTPTMKSLLEARIASKPEINIIPFMAEIENYQRGSPASKMPGSRLCDFLYVASGDAHKNHRLLVKAWCLLAEEGLFPSLRLTIDSQQFPELSAWISHQTERHRLKIENLENLDHEGIRLQYSQAGALIFPSAMESFGLPLIEARQAGLPVLASELDYVRDVLDPDQSFNPGSHISIARAVKRFLGVAEDELPLLDARGFFEKILQQDDAS